MQYCGRGVGSYGPRPIKHSGGEIHKLLKAWFIASVLAFAAAAAHAQSASDRGWYGGLSLAQTRSDVIDDISFLNVATAGTLSRDDKGSGYKLYAGYRFRRYFALEGGYTDFGSFSLTQATSPGPGSVTGTVKGSAFHIQAVRIYPIGDSILVFITGGAFGMQTKTTYSSGAGRDSPDYLFLKAGIGVEYRFSHALGMRVEYERGRELSIGLGLISGVGPVLIAARPGYFTQILSVGPTYRF